MNPLKEGVGFPELRDWKQQRSVPAGLEEASCHEFYSCKQMNFAKNLSDFGSELYVSGGKAAI